MRAGDGILKIGHVPAVHLDHQQAKMEIIRAGNELDFFVQRYNFVCLSVVCDLVFDFPVGLYGWLVVWFIGWLVVILCLIVR